MVGWCGTIKLKDKFQASAMQNKDEYDPVIAQL